VEDLRFAYGAAGGAFTLEEGELQVIAEGGPEAGARPRIHWTPVGTPDFVTTHVETAPRDSTTRIVAHYLPESRRLVLEGRVTAGGTDTLAFAVRDPVGEATAVLTRVVAESGVDVLGGVRILWQADTAGVACSLPSSIPCTAPRRLAGLRSPPLSEILAGILGPSQNWMAEQLTRTLGAERGTRGSWSEGVGVVTRFLVEDVGVDSLDVVLHDGSGLSAYNLVTPRALVQVLRHVAAGPDATAFRAALARPGEEDSTMEDRLPDLPGRVFAKTGVITNVNSLSGYLVRDDGGETVFSILSNGSGLPSARMREAIDQVVTLLAGESP
jgi:D-alanyl-D-alanine carboxypeptidase/D-alanyl-D-alanine-endopeptidase (penicillin-binding protein 4)